MKKLQFFLVVLALLAMLTSIAASPLAISLVQVRNDPGGGVMFVFHVNGHFSRADLKGFVQVQGGDANYNLFCTQVDETTVHCTTSRKTGGKNVVVTFGGATFWTFVPEAAPKYCYNVYEWLPVSTRSPFTFQTFTLQAFTTHCQEAPAQYGDMINLLSPYNSHSYDHVFMSQCASKIEDAYYFCAD